MARRARAALVCASLALTGCAAPAPPQDCATIDADAFVPRVLRNAKGLEVGVLPFGGTLQRLLVPTGRAPDEVDDILLGLCVAIGTRVAFSFF